ncbi:PASTA domain-containing protein [Bacillus sp. BHET2]|nr:PASTA domain-containing protein [Bacillus sp. BHET2]
MNMAGIIFFFLFALCFLLIFSRFLFIQVTGEVEGEDLVAEATSKYIKSSILESKRGTIFDRNSNVVAEDTSSFKLVGILSDTVTSNPKAPQHIVDKKKTAAILEKYIDMSESKIYRLLNQDDLFQVEFGTAGNDLSFQLKQKIEKEKLPGIRFVSKTKRLYPNGKFASQVLGVVRDDATDGNRKGILGLEKSLNNYLAGKDGNTSFKSDVWGYLLPDSNEHRIAPENGDKVYLTLDEKIQTFAEEAMNKVEKEYSPKKMFVIVSNPKTGEILAMSQRPSFNNNSREGLAKGWTNVNVETSYEPGSTLKSFSLATAVDRNVFDPDAYYESGKFYVEGNPAPIKDWNGGVGWGGITYLEGVQRSSNVAFTHLLGKIGEDEYLSYLKAFGFGQKTDIGLENETPGKILYTYPIEKATTIFGQGTTVTALQMIQAESAIANDGKMMKPYLISKIMDGDTNKVLKEAKPQVVGTPISKKSAEQTREYLTTTVTSDVGTGKLFNIEGYQVSGKSGTAQIPDPNGGGYLTGHDNYLSSFIGMAPAEDPELIVYVGIQQPNLNGALGSIPVAKVFNPVMENSLKYLNIKPAESNRLKTIHVPDMKGENISKVKEKVAGLGLTPVIIGNGKKVSQQSDHGTLIENEKIFIVSNDKTTIPDINGWSLRDVLKLENLLDIEVKVKGTGYVTNQSIKADTVISGEEKLVVHFKPRD